MAKAFSDVSRSTEGRGDMPYEFFMFNMESKIDDIYGTFSIVNGKPKPAFGSLYSAINDGKVFIADEFNLAEEATLQSLAVALEPSSGISVLVPGIGVSVTVAKKFMFIACQNDIRTIGRKALPAKIQKRLRMFEYPRPELDDLIANCQAIATLELHGDKEQILVDQAIAKRIAEFMDGLNNKLNLGSSTARQRENSTEAGKHQNSAHPLVQFLAPWSMRDIRKLFLRFRELQMNPRLHRNMTIELQVLYFVMGGVPPDAVPHALPGVMTLLVRHFSMSETRRAEMEACFSAYPEIKEEGHDVFLMKGNAGLCINQWKQQFKDVPLELHSLWNTLFYIVLAHHTEPLLLAGGSGFKTFLATKILPDAPVLTLNQDTNIAQLLGSVILLNSSKAREFLLDQFSRIAKCSDRLQSLKSMLREGLQARDHAESSVAGNLLSETSSGNESDEDANDIIWSDDENEPQAESVKSSVAHTDESPARIHLAMSVSPDLISELRAIANKASEEVPPSFKAVLEQLIDQLSHVRSDGPELIGFGDFTTIFKPGLFTRAVLDQQPLILKDLPSLSPAVFERFNELYSNNPILVLNEDFCDTFTTKESQPVFHWIPNYCHFFDRRTTKFVRSRPFKNNHDFRFCISAH
jgi:hypothetical protein